MAAITLELCAAMLAAKLWLCSCLELSKPSSPVEGPFSSFGSGIAEFGSAMSGHVEQPSWTSACVNSTMHGCTSL